MLNADRASAAFGITLKAVSPGAATCEMTVREDQTNGHGTCHGGVIFTLADTAFAAACNSYNMLAVAQSNSITYIAPGQLGDRLTAVARETSRAGRSGVYDVQVTNQDGAVIAEFRGLSRTLRGQHFEEGT